jgi:membrane-associated phospholipid phosphatase
VTRIRTWGGVLAAVGALALSVVLDPWVWRNASLAGIYERDWGRMLRVAGSLVFWVPLALAVWLAMRRAALPRPGRAALLVWGPALAGGVAELLKLLVRRERPGFADGAYVFRDFAERTWSTSGLGFPTSHGMVAFGGAAVLAGLFPGTAPVAYAIAAGCALTRVLAGAHFASDAVGGAIFGWAIGAFLWRRYGAVPTPTGKE